MSTPRPLAAAAVAVLLLGPAAASGAVAEDEQHAPANGVVAAQAAVRPRVAPAVASPLAPVVRGTPVAADVLTQRLADELVDEWIGSSVAITVRDPLTGEHLLDSGADRAVTPASLTKLLTAAAVATTLPMEEPFHTRVVAGKEPGDIVLVAGGDMLLARGAGDPEAVGGRAGLADLAQQVAAALAAPRPEAAEATAGPPPDAATATAGPPGSRVRLFVDTSYAAGPDRAPGWTDFWLRQGFTGPITMLGLSRDRAVPDFPAPTDPAQSAAQAFAEALAEAGVEVAGDPEDPVPELAVAGDAEVLAEVASATAGDVLALALSDSDNALTEQLARQAALYAGVGPDHEAVTAWVVEQVAGYGIDVTGVELADTSGLSDGTTIPVRVVADVLVAGSNGEHPGLQASLGQLPIAGYTGTLWNRFHLPVHEPAVGIARAKTGSLPGVTSLAGVVVTVDGRLLVFAVVADDIGPDGAVLEARSVVDEMVAELAGCGC